MSVRTKLLWERRYRAACGLSQFSVTDVGSVLLLCPRPLESRTYDLAMMHPDSSSRKVAELTVETLQKLSTSRSTNVCVGMTGDDFYVFHDGVKSRLFPSKYYLTVDVVMDETGIRAAGAYSDLAGENYTVFLTNLDGTVIWAEDVDFAPRVVATASGGRALVAAGDGGIITCQDTGAQDIWRFHADDSISALCCSKDVEEVVYGTDSGAIGAIDAFGTRKWESRYTGSIPLLASALTSGLTAAVVDSGELGNTIYLIDEQGVECGKLPILERVTGVGFSPDGSTLAVSQRNGVVSVYGITNYSAPVSATGAPDDVERAVMLLDQHNWLSACLLLMEICGKNKQDVHAARHLVAARVQLVHGAIEQAEDLAKRGDFSAALKVIAAARKAAELSTELAEYQRSLSIQASVTLTKQAELITEGDPIESERLLADALEIWDENLEAREHLAGILARRVIIADTKADEMVAAKNLEAAISALHTAQSIAATEERSAKIRILSIQSEFNLGLVEYDSGQYDKARFHFLKVLKLDPDNRQARRYLEFSEQFARAADQESDPLSNRFKMLE